MNEREDRNVHHYMSEHRSKRRWHKVITFLSGIIVFCTVYALILPAVTLAQAEMKCSAEVVETTPGNNLVLDLAVSANTEEQDIYYYLSTQQDNAGPSAAFDGNDTAVINDSLNREVELHRQYEEDGSVGYWFVLGKHEDDIYISIPCTNGIGKMLPVSSEKVIEKIVETEEITPQPELIESETVGQETTETGVEDNAEIQTEEIIPEEKQLPEMEENENIPQQSEPIVEYITVPYTDWIVETGNPELTGSFKVVYGSGTTLENAKEDAGRQIVDESETVELNWISEEEFNRKHEVVVSEMEPENSDPEISEATDATEDIEEDQTEETIAEEDVEIETVEYTATTPDGISVSVEVNQNAFEQDVSLVVKNLNQDTLEYQQAKQTLDESEQIIYDGFLALDIHFEDEKGEEVEPDEASGEIRVRINAESKIPDTADTDSVVIQHHIETTEHQADSVVVLEEVAGPESETGTVEIMESEQTDDTGRNLIAEFEVKQFSIFTVTWADSTHNATLRIHYVDELGREIADERIEEKFNPARQSEDRVLCSDYAKNLIGSGYYYQGAYTAPTDGNSVAYVTYVDDETRTDFGFRYRITSEEIWGFLGINGEQGVRGGNIADLYLRYRYVFSEDTDDTFIHDVETEYSDYGPESGQVMDSGGTNTSTESDGVSVSKTLDPTEIENVFDITLSVTTKTKVDEVEQVQPLDVVIVMDISNTMKSTFSGDTNGRKRCDVAVEAASNFIKQFQEASQSLSCERKVGLVLFNTGLVEGFDLSECKTEQQKNGMISRLKEVVERYRDDTDYDLNYKPDGGLRRFTNMETGIVKAQQMLEGTGSQNKYMIFLTDGFPTTYGLPGTSYTTKVNGKNETSTNGIIPYDSEGSIMKNRITGHPCTYGTSYSDTAAHWAEEHAKEAKSLGIRIFSIGVDVKGQSIANYESQESSSHSVIEAIGNTQSSWRKAGTYVIDDIAQGGFEGWLENQIGSGPGYYFDSTDTNGLLNAFQTIFDTIKQQTEYAVSASWVAEDPITSDQNSDYIEFIDFFNRANQLNNGALTGSAGVDRENTATWNSITDTISWDLKNSGYQMKVVDGVTYYTYSLKYRVRLENEKEGFVDSESYYTNGKTTLLYREVINGSLRERKRIKFPIPQVQGYIEEFMFYKIRSDNKVGLSGAEFTLTHSSDCNVCHGDNTPVTLKSLTGISDEHGVVSFKGVPSGHDYILTETKAPPGFIILSDSYRIGVHYNSAHTDAEITWTDSDGKQNVINTEKPLNIENEVRYELPNTGGSGTEKMMIIGFILVMISGGILLYRQKNNRGGGITP